ncbi:uncharacterized protein [Eleutherodactylus coqui]|uniref:uncharacterized protein isoform X2 n=1 Tax=Eleutherodactylus coqui TaxID=57060 RepID=UPI00346246AF
MSRCEEDTVEMEALREEIKEAVRQDGIEWLEEILSSYMTSTAVTGTVEQEAQRRGAAEDEDEREILRGRPQRRKQPPARLSPSPVARRGGRRSSLATEGQRAAETPEDGRAPPAKQAAGRKTATGKRLPPAGGPEECGRRPAAPMGCGLAERRASGRRTSPSGRMEQRHHGDEVQGNTRRSRALPQDGGRARQLSRVAVNMLGGRGERDQGEGGLRAVRGGLSAGGGDQYSPDHSVASSVGSMGASIEGSARDRESVIAETDSSHEEASSGERPLAKVYNPTYRAATGRSVRGPFSTPRSSPSPTTGAASTQRLADSTPACQLPPAGSSTQRGCFINPRYLSAPAGHEGTQSQTSAYRSAGNRQGRGAKRRQRERARREQRGSRRSAGLEQGWAGYSSSFRERETARGRRSSSPEESQQSVSHRISSAPQLSRQDREITRRRRHIYAQERSDRDYPGTSQAGRAQEAPREVGRQPSPGQDRRHKRVTTSSTPLATPEVGRAGIGQEHYVHRIQAAHCRACEVLIPDVPELLTAHITSLTHKENFKATSRTIKINSYAVAKELFLDEKILQMSKKYLLKEKPIKKIVACLSQVNSTEDVLVAEEDDDDRSDEYAIADPEVLANHNEDSIADAKAHPEVPGNHNEDAIADAKAHPKVPGHPGSNVPCPPMNIPKNMPSSSTVNPQLIPKSKMTNPDLTNYNRFQVQNDFEFAEDFDLEEAPKSLKIGPTNIFQTEKKCTPSLLHQAGEEKKKEDIHSTSKKPHKSKNQSVSQIVKRYQFTCSFCKFHTLYDEEMKRHLQSRFHEKVFHYIEEKFSKQVADFLQEEMLHSNKKTEERRGLVEDLNTTIQQINCNQDLTQVLGMEHFLKKIEAAHCVACDKILPMYCSILQQHIESNFHDQNSRIMMKNSKENALHTAKTVLEQNKRKLKQYMQGQNPFLNDEKDNSRKVCSTDPAPEAKGPGQVPCCSLANSNQSYKKQVKEQEDAPSGQDIGEENTEDCDYACEALDYAEVDAPPYKKTKMA